MPKTPPIKDDQLLPEDFVLHKGGDQDPGHDDWSLVGISLITAVAMAIGKIARAHGKVGLHAVRRGLQFYSLYKHLDWLVVGTRRLQARVRAARRLSRRRDDFAEALWYRWRLPAGPTMAHLARYQTILRCCLKK